MCCLESRESLVLFDPLYACYLINFLLFLDYIMNFKFIAAAWMKKLIVKTEDATASLPNFKIFTWLYGSQFYSECFQTSKEHYNEWLIEHVIAAFSARLPVTTGYFCKVGLLD